MISAERDLSRPYHRLITLANATKLPFPACDKFACH